ncbi:ABC-2 type transport system permease protein [Sphingomonas sp. SORGH_AS802]|jgi:ABC-2 type transport system permease protein|uniref:ABC transporter permease n=1 Tax=unclassified Sphingomonas TaxID=196159 RepID=UPI000F7F2224|nr:MULTISPECIES: ABC transporter permease [unclassified Sphingomonas]MDR6125446.1 ABC-2 type transport system permease protein [Sphingomonas sp. SORGH_AS_0438]MDR6134062.1 ABC-2 type transport system permease protein [Sphingomonas sp. SORGH_AS_0802]RSU47908.1 sugar ABC transporter permease [Sphingomonas sp. S-NIH.Pt15_0812]
MNLHGIWAIYRFEMARFGRTIWTSLAVPVITTSLYFIVFGSAIGSQMREVSGVPYGAFIVPGLMLLAIFSESILNASLGIYMPKFTGTIYEILSAPLSPIETVMGYVGAATTKSLLIGLIIFATAHLFVDLPVAHPFLMLLYLVLVAAAFCLFGFAIGILANGFEQLQVVPLLIVTPMTFLGGAFYSVQILPEPWRTITLFNPVVYLINGFRWTFFGQSDVGVGISLGVSFAFLCACLAFVTIIFRTGWRLKA